MSKTYLGFTLDEYMKDEAAIQMLSDSNGTVLGSVIVKILVNFHSTVCGSPTVNYAAGI